MEKVRELGRKVFHLVFDRGASKKTIADCVKPLPRIILQRGDKMIDRQYPLKDEEFEYLVEFMKDQPDKLKIMINAPFVKALVEEITVLRREKRLRLRLVETENGDDSEGERPQT